MHILHLTWEYPPLVYGGIGRHVPALAAAQAARGDQVTVVTQRPPEAPAVETAAGVEVLRVDPDGPFPYHLPSLLTWVGALDARIGQAATDVRDVDIVHAHDWVVARAGASTAAALDVPLVATVHATEAGRHSGWLPDIVSRSVHLVEQWLVDDADAVIVCSAAMADEVHRAHETSPTKITVIPNGIDPGERPAPGPIGPRLLEGSPRITFVGRLEWEKGVFTAVEAMPAVLVEHPGARLRMVGTGGQGDAIAEAVTAAGLDGTVELLGHVDLPAPRPHADEVGRQERPAHHDHHRVDVLDPLRLDPDAQHHQVDVVVGEELQAARRHLVQRPERERAQGEHEVRPHVPLLAPIVVAHRQVHQRS